MPATALRALLSNRLREAELAWRHRRFARAILVRRSVESVYARFPGLPDLLSFPRPVEVVVALTSRCQLRCRMCGIRKVMRRPEYRNLEIDLADLIRLLDEVERWRPRPYIKFTGGEPLLYSQIIPLLRACGERRLPFRLSTNGCLLSRPELANEVVASGLDVLTVSLDGTEELHNQIRGGRDAFARTVQGIGNVDLAKRAMRSAAPLLQLTTVVHAVNQGCLRELFALLRGLPLQWWNVQLLNYISPEGSHAADQVAGAWGYGDGPWSEFVQDSLCEVDASRLAADLEWLRRQQTPFAKSFLEIGGHEDERLRAYYQDHGASLRQRLCVVPFLSLHVVPNGDLVFCIDYPYVTYGNLRDGPVSRAWTSEVAVAFRRRLVEHYRRGGTNLPQCNRCNWLYN